MNNLLLSIGANKSKGTGISRKARLLDAASKAKIPVPQSFMIRDEIVLEALLRRFLDENIHTGEITCPRPRAFAEWLGLPTFGCMVTVRHAFDEEEEHADDFETVWSINANDPEDLAQSLCSVWSSSVRVEGDFRRDVIIMEMVDAELSGIAYSEPAYEDDLLLVNDESLQLAKLWSLEVSSSDDWTGRLQKLLKQIRREFDDENWEIQWVDDGQNCYLIGLKPIRNSPQRNEQFVLLEHVPILPNAFLSDLAASCSSDIYQKYRQLDKTLPKKRILIEVFEGRAYLNQSLLNDTLCHWGLFAFNWRRILIKIVQLVLPKLALFYLGRQSSEISPENWDNSFTEMIEVARELYTEWIVLQLPVLRRGNLVYQECIEQNLITVRKAIVKQARELVEQGILPEADCIWLLKLDELRQLDEGWLPSGEFFEQRRAEINDLHYSDLPKQSQNRVSRKNHIQQDLSQSIISSNAASA